MILAPLKPKQTSFNSVVSKRCSALNNGKWRELWDTIVFKDSTHQHQPSQPNLDEDPLDAAALKAQYHMTRHGSVSAAARTIKSPIVSATASVGSLLSTFKSLHPQVGDPLPPHPATPPPNPP